MKKLLLISLAMALSVSRSHAQEKPAAPDQSAVEGTWIVLSHTVGGKKATDIGFRTCAKIVLSGDEIRFGDDKALPIKIDLEKMPYAIDVQLPGAMMAGAHLKGIYALDKDELKLCLARSQVGKRPTKFAGDDVEIFILKRKK